MPAPICPKCGFNNPPGMRFCGNCGAKLPVGTAPLQLKTPSSEFSPDQVGVMMGADLIERFRKAGLEASGQRRVVTILFVDLSGYTAFSQQVDNEDAYVLIQQYLSMLAKNVYRYEGMVDKFMGDGLMAIFGAPIAHENSAEMAIRAALDMQREMTEFSEQAQSRTHRELQLHFGLHTGSVIVGGLGTSMMMNYTAIGDTVNLANRLEQECPSGAILVSETTYQNTHALFDFEQAGQLTLKGIDHPVPAYRVIGVKQTPGSMRGIEGLHAPLIGREEELARLKIITAQVVEQKSGHMVIIQGEAGIGKTRLAYELTSGLAPGRMRVLEGRCYIYRRAVAYWVFLDLLRAWLKLASDTEENVVREALRSKTTQLLGERARTNLPYLEYLFSLKPSDPEAADRLDYLDAAQLRQQIFLAIREVLVAEAHRTPLALVLEDLHWADETSLDLLSFLMDTFRQEPILILVVTRPVMDGPLIKIEEKAARLLGDQFQAIQLKSLNQDQSERLLMNLMANSEIPAELHRQIVDRAAGIPFYLEEILRMMIDEKIIRLMDGKWLFVTDAGGKKVGVPETLQGLILARFDHLSELGRRVLQVASIFGRGFNASLIATLVDITDPSILVEELRELAERGFVVPETVSSDPDYVFKHTLVLEAIYGTLLKAERAELHTRVGEALEKKYANRLDEHIDLLARHFAAGVQAERGLHYSILAGQKAARDFANQQARSHFEFARELLPRLNHPAEQTIQVETGLGDLLALAGEYPLAREHYQIALEILKGRPDGKQTAILLRKIGTTHERQGDYDQALRCLSEAQHALDLSQSPHTVERAWILNDMGWIDTRRANFNEAEKNLLTALALVEDSQQYDLIASIYNRLGGVYYQEEKLDEASNFVRKSLVLRQEIGDVNAVARSYSNLGLLGWKRGDWDSALENFKRSVELHATLGDIEGTVALHSNLGLLYLDRGDFAEARKHLSHALTTAEQIGHAYYTGLAYLHLSRYAVLHEEWQKALDFCQKCGGIFKELGVRDYLVDVSTNIGLAWLGMGDIEKAHYYSREALMWSTRDLGGSTPTNLSEDRGRALRLMGQTAMARGDHETAHKALQESAAIFRELGNQLEKGRTAYVFAGIAAAENDEETTRKMLNEARLIFRQLGARADLRKVESFRKSSAHIQRSL